MSIPRTVAEVLENHVTFQLEGIDRMYLNLYVPRLQTEKGAAHFWRFHRAHRFAASSLMDPMTKDFVRCLERFAQDHAIPLVTCQRKDDVAQRFFPASKVEEGVVFIGKAQERVRGFHPKQHRSSNGGTYPWIVRSTALVNQWYVYLRDRDFGPCFLKFSSHFRYQISILQAEFSLTQVLDQPVTTINETRDFGVGKSLKNRPALRQIGFPANRRLLDVQTIGRSARSIPSRWASVPVCWATPFAEVARAAWPKGPVYPGGCFERALRYGEPGTA